MAWGDHKPFGGLISRFGALQTCSFPIIVLLIKLVIFWQGATRSIWEAFFQDFGPLKPGVWHPEPLHLCQRREHSDNLDDPVGALPVRPRVRLCFTESCKLDEIVGAATGKHNGSVNHCEMIAGANCMTEAQSQCLIHARRHM